MTRASNPYVFLSYASEDKERVREHRDWLRSAGVQVWWDDECLLPGQDWDVEIRKALEAASIVILFLSKTSVGKRGYFQREQKLAIRKREESLISDISLIPVLLDSVVLPDELSLLHAIDVRHEHFQHRILTAIESQIPHQDWRADYDWNNATSWPLGAGAAGPVEQRLPFAAELSLADRYADYSRLRHRWSEEELTNIFSIRVDSEHFLFHETAYSSLQEAVSAALLYYRTRRH